MKKIKIIVLLLLWMIPLTTIWWTITKDTTIFEIIDIIKNTIKFDSITINSEVPYNLIQDAIEKYCPKDAVNDAKKSVNSFVNARSNINTSNKWQTLTDRFNLLKENIKNQNEKDEYKYCKQSYLAFSLLKVTQELYNGERAIKETTTPSITKTTTTESKTTTNNSTQKHNSATSKLNFHFNHNTSWLPSGIRNTFSADTEKYLQDTILDLFTKHILDYNDINTLNNKINVTYLQTCKTTEWDFRITKNSSTNKYTFKEINLIIAYCETNNTPQKHQRHVQQILAHELWHYIYFFKDKNPSAFSEICRNNGKTNCLTTEFVTNYARKSAEEDYAESFAYRYLYSKKWNNNKDIPNDNPINQRERHFERLFEEFEEDDDDEKTK